MDDINQGLNDSRPPIESTGGNRSARLLTVCLATISLAGSLWAALGSSDCGDCGRARELVAGIPLAWVGVAFYTALASVAARAGLSRWAKAGFFAASGAHVVLLTLLVRERMLCTPCLVTASAAIAGGLVSLAARPHVGRWAATVFLAAALVTLGGITAVHNLSARQPMQAAPEIPGSTASKPIDPGHVRLLVYEREGCKHCLEFEEQMLPELKKEFGGALEVERTGALLDMQSPTIIVEGNGDKEFDGLPAYEELEAAIRDVLPKQPQ